MKYKIEFRDQQEDIVIYARKRSSVLEELEALLERAEEPLFGYIENDTVRLDAGSVYCFFTEDGRVYADTDSGRLQVRERLYQLEATYSDSFVKINQSCLVNISKIKKFNSSIGGALLVVLDNGYKDYVSRRQLKSVKERIGF